jgi:hypothetical protein
VKSTGIAAICTCIHRLNRSSFTTTDDSVANRKLAAGTAGRKTSGASREFYFTLGRKSSRRCKSEADGRQSQRDEKRRKPKIGYWPIGRCNGRQKSDTHRRLLPAMQRRVEAGSSSQAWLVDGVCGASRMIRSWRETEDGIADASRRCVAGRAQRARFRGSRRLVAEKAGRWSSRCKSAVLIASRSGGYKLRWKPETHSGVLPQDVKAGGSRGLIPGLAGG